MFSSRPFLRLSACALCCLLAVSGGLAQSGRVVKPSSPASGTQEGQADVKVYTEEVRIPIFARDDKGNLDPTLERDDVLVLEDDVPQEVRSIRRIPASILLVLGTGNELNPAASTNTTRTIALNLLANVRDGDNIAVLQFTNRVEVLQEWTADKQQVARTLRSKVSSGKGSRLSQAIIRAAKYLGSQPIGNRHLVLVTDGVETPGRMDYKEALRVLSGGYESPEVRAQATEAVKQLNAAQAAVHVISYTTLGELAIQGKQKKEQEQIGMVQSRADISRVGIDPTKPPGMGGAPSVNSGFRFDPQMRRLRQAYELAMKRSEQRLTTFAEETGGRMWLPTTEQEMFAQAAEVAREIGAQYVLTYRPKRPLSEGGATEYRRIVVAPRRIGLNLRSRRGYVVASMRQP